MIKTSSDKILNSRGRQLLSLCISSGTRVLNGRTLGDLCGSYTCYQPSGSSVVDYMLVSEDLLTSVSYFLVHNLSDLSDHCQISCMIQCNYNIVQKENTGLSMPDKYIWDDTSQEKNQNALISHSAQELIIKFKNNTYSESNLDIMIDDLNNIFITVGDISLKKKKFRTYSKHHKFKHKPKDSKPWFDTDLYKLKRELDNKCQLLQKYSFDPVIRGSYFKCLKNYRKKRKFKMRCYKKELFDKLDNLQNPKAYWNLVEQLKSDTKNENKSLNITLDEWKHHFQKLNGNNPKSSSLYIK